MTPRGAGRLTGEIGGVRVAATRRAAQEAALLRNDDDHYMGVTLVWLLIAPRFVNPTQLVLRVKEHPQVAT
jgi:hypothetical protein